MADIICGGIIVIILGLAIGYIIKAKKAGVKCIGCSAANGCAGHCSTDFTIEIDPNSETPSQCSCSEAK